MADLQLEELEEMPEIAYKLGIVPHDWKNETAGIWADNELEEAVPIRGSGFGSTSHGGAGALNLNNPRSNVNNNVSFRSASPHFCQQSCSQVGTSSAYGLKGFISIPKAASREP